VLISILHFALHDASTQRWLDGEGGDELSILGATPRSLVFQEYVAGARARALLVVTSSWWLIPTCCQVRYEDLLRKTPEVIRQLIRALSEPAVHSPETAAEEMTIRHLRSALHHQAHFWQGRAELWKDLLPAAEAGILSERLHDFLAPLGYRCDPDAALTASQADANWVKLAGLEAAEMLGHTRALKQELAEAQRSLRSHQEQLQSAQRALQMADRHLQDRQAQILQVHAALAKARDDVAALRARLAPFLNFGPWSLGLARRAQNITRCFPRLSATVKKCLQNCARARAAWANGEPD
jgi:hypothetical protein